MPDPLVVSPAPAIICSGALLQRYPPSFGGTNEQYIEDWLSSYDCVGIHNKWDDVMKFNNEGFYLEKVAELFRNNEAGIATWSALKTRFTEVFGRRDVRKLPAQQCLRVRERQTGETFTSCINDVWTYAGESIHP